MISTHDAQAAIAQGGTAVSSDGHRIGKLTRVYLDDDTGQPSWGEVESGLLGRTEHFVPLTSGSVEGDDIRVPFTRDEVHSAPDVHAHEGHLSKADDAALHHYYEGKGTAQDKSGADQGVGLDPRRAADDDGRVERTERTERSAAVAGSGSVAGTGAATGGNADAEPTLVRSEEQVQVGTRRVPVTRVRLRRVVVTESVTQTIPVSHEEFRLEEVPISEADGPDVVSGDAVPASYEFVLRAERIVVTKEVAPVERVRVRVDTVTGEQRVTTEVQKERVVADEIKTNL